MFGSRKVLKPSDAMQQAENGGEEEATVDVQFTDLPNALIACKVPEDLFEGILKVCYHGRGVCLTQHVCPNPVDQRPVELGFRITAQWL